MDMHEAPKSLMAVCAKQRVRSRSILSHAYVIPIEHLGADAHKLWADPSAEREFNVRLGQAASAYLERELQNRGTVLSVSDVRERLEIGISGGTTVHATVRGMRGIQLPKPTRISPLVLGPLPQARYAAETIAAILQERLPNSVVEEEVEIRIAPSGLSDTPEIQIHIQDGAKKTLMTRDFDWLITGVGAKTCASFQAAEQIICGQVGCLRTVIGDVFSRFFSEMCEEESAKKLDAFVALDYDRIKELAHRSEDCRVVAIASGGAKVPAIKALLRTGECVQPQARQGLLNSGVRLVNTLVTDELTAMAVVV